MMNNYKYGGGIENENAEMVMNNNNQIKHHTEELEKIVTPETEVPAWVVSKVGRSASDLSDATHYLDGVSKMKYANGGGVGSLTDNLKIVEIKSADENSIILNVILDGKVVEMEFEADELIEEAQEYDEDWLYLFVTTEKYNGKEYEITASFLGHPDYNLDFVDVEEGYVREHETYANGGGVGFVKNIWVYSKPMDKKIRFSTETMYSDSWIDTKSVIDMNKKEIEALKKQYGKYGKVYIYEEVDKYAKGSTVKGGAISRYRLVPYKERVKGYIESVGEKQVVVESTYEGASQKAVELLYSERDFVTVDIVKLGKSVLSSKKIAKVNSQGIVKYADGGGVEYRSYVNNIYRNQSEQPARDGLMRFASEQGFEISDVENALQVYKYDTEENAWGENYYTKVAIERMVDMISGKKFADGGSIPNNYDGKAVRHIWNSWSVSQRKHFLHDHSSEELQNSYGENYTTYLSEVEIENLAEVNYEDLPQDIKTKVFIHTDMGQYADGGGVKHKMPINISDLYDKVIEKYMQDHNVSRSDAMKVIPINSLTEQKVFFADGGGVGIESVGEPMIIVTPKYSFPYGNSVHLQSNNTNRLEYNELIEYLDNHAWVYEKNNWSLNDMELPIINIFINQRKEKSSTTLSDLKLWLSLKNWDYVNKYADGGGVDSPKYDNASNWNPDYCKCIKDIRFKDSLNFFEGFEYTYDEHQNYIRVYYMDGRGVTMTKETFDKHFEKIGKDKDKQAYANGGAIKTDFNELENTELRNVLISFWNDFFNNHIGNYLSIEKENYILSNIDNVFVIVRDEDKGNFSDVEKQNIDRFLSPYFDSDKKPLFTDFFNNYEIKDNKIIIYIKDMYANGGGISDILYTDSFELDKEKLAKAKYHIAYNRGIYTVIDNKTKKPITSFPTQASAVNYIKTNFGSVMANGGGVGEDYDTRWAEMEAYSPYTSRTEYENKKEYEDLAFASKTFSKTSEMLVRENLMNGEICICKLRKILGHEPAYPVQYVGSIKLTKCFLKPFYKI